MAVNECGHIQALTTQSGWVTPGNLGCIIGCCGKCWSLGTSAPSAQETHCTCQESQHGHIGQSNMLVLPCVVCFSGRFGPPNYYLAWN